MKSVAILKDSIRESWDSKILLVLLILTALLSLFIFSISYEPVPAESVLNQTKIYFPQHAIDKGKSPMSSPFERFNVGYEVLDFKETVPAGNPANAEYQFTLKASPSQTMNGAKEPKKEFPKGKGPLEPKIPMADDFQRAVALWHMSTDDYRMAIGNKEGTAEEERQRLQLVNITPQMMEDFISERYDYHFNMKLKTVQRMDGPAQGDQLFKIVTANSDPRAWPHHTALFFGTVKLKEFFPEMSLGLITYIVQDYIVNGIGAGIAIILGIIVTSFFIPNMMRKGSIDLMLSKPVSRVGLLVSKYFGGLSFMFFFATFAIGSVWVVFGIRTGLWNFKTLLVIPLLTYSFAVLYAMSTLVSVWTRSAIASLLVTLAFAGGLWIFGKAYDIAENIKKVKGHDNSSSWVYPTLNTIDAVLPHTRDMDKLTSILIADVMTPAEQQKSGTQKSAMPNLYTVFGVSFAWIVVMLGLASWRFAKKDY